MFLWGFQQPIHPKKNGANGHFLDRVADARKSLHFKRESGLITKLDMVVKSKSNQIASFPHGRSWKVEMSQGVACPDITLDVAWT